eukprot:4855951-Pleurochrysis_carterae.AAC.2
MNIAGPSCDNAPAAAISPSCDNAVLQTQPLRLRILSIRLQRSRSFVAVNVFHRCKFLNGFSMLPQRRMKFGESRLEIRCRTSRSILFASLALL